MAAAEKLTINLPRDLADLVRQRVETGEYASDSEVVETALRLWAAHDQDRRQKLEHLREKVRRSLDDPRPSISADEVFDELDARYAKE